VIDYHDQLFFLARHSREGGNSVTLVLSFAKQKLPLQAAGNFLLDGKKSPKNVFCCSR
jgi:hypothetical protein